MPTISKEEIRRKIKHEISSFSCAYKEERGISSISWLDPIVGFAGATSQSIRELSTVVSPTHLMPEDVMEDAKTIVSYFLPFNPEIGKANRDGDSPSRIWVEAYGTTNEMFAYLNEHLVAWLASEGFRAAVPANIGTIDKTHIYSNRSQRHIARAAGIGTFGMNNMLITQRGTCGRFSSIVTNVCVEPDLPAQEEFCLYKRSGTCGACVGKCPVGALSHDGSFNRENCYERLLVIERELGADVCGKCTVGLPCTFKRP